MWKEQYRKANDDIPVNEELLGSLLKTAAKVPDEKKHYVFRVGTVAAAVMIGIGMVSFSHLRGETEHHSNPVAEASQPSARLVQEPQIETHVPSLSETVQQAETPMVAGAQNVVVTPEPVVEQPEIPKKENEDLANLPATASAGWSRMVPVEEELEEILTPESKETIQTEIEEIDEKGELQTEEIVQESPSPTPTPESESEETEESFLNDN